MADLTVLIIGGDLIELLLSNGLDSPSPAVVLLLMVTLPVVGLSIQLILQAKPTALLKIERDEISVDVRITVKRKYISPSYFPM